MSINPFVRLDKDSPPTEIRFDCCPTPEPTIDADSDDPKAWVVRCESCLQDLCFLTAPDDSTTLIERITLYPPR
jgi:hypothetical protein